MQSEKTNLYPMDFSTLHKGMTIPVEDVERITGMLKSSPRYWSRMLRLRKWIERKAREHGMIWTTRTDHGAIVICDDADASQYNRTRGKHKLRGYVRHHVQNMAVDISKLDDAARKAHERTLLVNSQMLAAMKRTRAQLTLKPTKRTTPGIAGPTKPAEKKEEENK